MHARLQEACKYYDAQGLTSMAHFFAIPKDAQCGIALHVWHDIAESHARGRQYRWRQAGALAEASVLILLQSAFTEWRRLSRWADRILRPRLLRWKGQTCAAALEQGRGLSLERIFFGAWRAVLSDHTWRIQKGKSPVSIPH